MKVIQGNIDKADLLWCYKSQEKKVCFRKYVRKNNMDSVPLPWYGLSNRTYPQASETEKEKKIILVSKVEINNIYCEAQQWRKEFCH